MSCNAVNWGEKCGGLGVCGGVGGEGEGCESVPPGCNSCWRAGEQGLLKSADEVPDRQLVWTSAAILCDASLWEQYGLRRHDMIFSVGSIRTPDGASLADVINLWPKLLALKNEIEIVYMRPGDKDYSRVIVK